MLHMTTEDIIPICWGYIADIKTANKLHLASSSAACLNKLASHFKVSFAS